MYLGCDIGGTNIKVGILNSDLELTFKKSIKTNSDLGFNYTKKRIIEFIRDCITYYENTDKGNIVSIGIGFPSVVNDAGFVFTAPNLEGWNNLNLTEIFEKPFSKYIAIDNDANVAALAESIIGAGKNLNNFLYVTLGTGVGGGLIINNKIFRGDSGGAGEIGHTIIDFDDSRVFERSFRLGVLEEFVSKDRIIEEFFIENKRYDGSDKQEYDYENMEVKMISNLAKRKYFPAVNTLKTIGFYFGIGMVNSMTILGIEKIIIGGGISKISKVFYDAASKVIKSRAIPSIASNFQILRAEFTSDAGIIGAALLGRDKFLENNLI